MITGHRNHLIIEHQIERLLLSAHIESREGVDLIDEYFLRDGSLDRITKKASLLLDQESDPKYIEIICRNLSECIVVKIERERRSLMGFVKRMLGRLGVSPKKDEQITRAEQLIQSKAKWEEKDL